MTMASPRAKIAFSVAFLLVLGAAGGAALLLSGGDTDLIPPLASSEALPREKPVSTVAAKPVARPAQPQLTATTEGEATGWKDFQSQFGFDLVPVFSEGKLVSISAGGSGRAAADGSFDPRNPQQAIARARQVLDAAASLIGVLPEWPLLSPGARTGALFARVTFLETYNGSPVLPGRNCTVDLGRRGELEALYCSYSTDHPVVNAVKLTLEDARMRAYGAFLSAGVPDATPRAEGGGLVVWVSGREARYAYEFSVNGWQIIVDAETGATLLQKDRRQR